MRPFAVLATLMAPVSLVAQAPKIPGPTPETALLHAAFVQPTPPISSLLTVRRTTNWKSAVIIGAVAGAAFGLAVASQDGDEGSERSFSDRLSDGVVAGAIIAVPVTVIVAILTGGE